jgi:hypothetical protein
MKGLNVFGKHFSGYQDNYAVIGGVACELLLLRIPVVNPSQIIGTLKTVFFD